MIIKPFYRRNLPHITINRKAYFITFRTAGSVPTEYLIKLKTEFANEVRVLKKNGTREFQRKLIYELQKSYFYRFDLFLNSAAGVNNYLANENTALLVSESIFYRDKRDYELLSFCVMPNHVHMLIFVERFVKPLYKILQSLKRYTARHGNLLLNRSGEFWHPESYDHLIRDYWELARANDYILYDPVRTKLTQKAENWRWSYSKY